MAGRMIVGYAWMSDHLTKEELYISTSFMFFFDSLSSTISNIYFQYISKDWRYIFAVPLILQGLISILYLFLDEGPKFNYLKNNFK